MSAFIADIRRPELSVLMVKALLGSPSADPLGWARQCRIEAARAIHPSTRAFLLKLAAEFEAVAGEVVVLDPDDRIFRTRWPTAWPNSPLETGHDRAEGKVPFHPLRT